MTERVHVILPRERHLLIKRIAFLGLKEDKVLVCGLIKALRVKWASKPRPTALTLKLKNEHIANSDLCIGCIKMDKIICR